MPRFLNAEQIDHWERYGYAVLSDFVAPAVVGALRARVDEIVSKYVEEGVPDGAATVFSTTEQTHAQDTWFLESADVVRPFFENGAFDSNGHQVVPMELALNKLGHAIHDLDPVFGPFSRSDAMAALADDLGFVEPLLLQSMVIFKPPRIGSEVVCHCDHSFLWTEPQTVVGFWFALDNATVENGCMWAIPGGHTKGPRTRFRKVGHGTTTDLIDETPYDMGDLVPLEVEAGTCIAFHGCLPHWSAPNTSDQPRLAYTLHLIDGTAEYLSDNWLQRSSNLPLRGFGPLPEAR